MSKKKLLGDCVFHQSKVWWKVPFVFSKWRQCEYSKRHDPAPIIMKFTPGTCKEGCQTDDPILKVGLAFHQRDTPRPSRVA